MGATRVGGGAGFSGAALAGAGGSGTLTNSGNPQVPGAMGSVRMRPSSTVVGAGTTRTGVVTRWPSAVTLTLTVPSASGHMNPRGSSTTWPDASRTTSGRPESSGPTRTAT